MLNLIGTYHCKADNKGRVMVPADLKKQLSAVLAEGFVLKRAVFQPCLELYPMDQWNELMQKIGGLNQFNRKNNDFTRRFTAGVRRIELDATGRMNIPADLMSVAQIKRDLVLTASVGIVEIWDAQKYEQAISDAALDFADLAEEVMGTPNTTANELS
ncbi:MAG: division/cell wall cluster transcriptional repressor MraZ [Bacteroidetes bacterium]|nr:division/cell wall cluster transcriptional repressor MraZ [Flavobacteriaceae bacterium]MDA0719507.1 division/cell wall cluster transcriptional repressor MraZ [Bacteroidota bacterium]MDA0863433.1 division/cell wall cluster transcriptional repressor MraZ [Bacteroidota bacterium]HCK06329.1 division/cell wall cluster transcriptional repressor MraZ [Flavobacteriaceae bacterium]